MNYHLIGIKGVGMTAMAQILKAEGHTVQGSDTEEIFFTDKILKKLNISFYNHFDLNNLKNDVDIVIKSSAYGDENIEVIAAKKKNIPILDYPQALGELSKNHFAVAVAGTHGKTTQSALLGVMSTECNLDPLCIIGSSVPQFNNMNARIQNKKNDLMIAETCEYKNNFLFFNPNMILIPSLDYDHVDFFKTKQDYINSFITFIYKLPLGGTLIICGDSIPKGFIERIKKERKDIEVISYGFNLCNDIIASLPKIKDQKQTATISSSNFTFSIKIPGEHNILNALGAIIALEKIAKIKNIKLDYKTIKKSLLSFNSTKRRLEKLGDYKSALLFDDYAHHPVEISATIKAVKSYYPNKRIRIIFQSHTFSRTKKLEKDFALSFMDADEIIIAPIYPSAREKMTKYTSETFANTINTKNKDSKYFSTYQEITNYIKETIEKDDIVIAMGAGDIWKTLTPILNGV